jgi:CubicO group peptidase (beta-lactamase class C family)
MIGKLHSRKDLFIAYLIIIAFLFSCSEKVHYRYRVPEKTDDGWATAELSEAGVDSERIGDLIREVLNKNFKNIDSLLLVKDGKLILEEYFNEYGRDDLHELHSVSKSITSILVGIAIDKGMIPNLDTKVYAFFPEYKATRWVDQKYDITLKHLLIMSAGIDWDERTRPLNDPRNDIIALIFHSDDWIQYVLNKKVVEPPGLRWNYSGGLTILLGGIIKNTSGLYADTFAEQYLFGPLGISNYAWHRHADGAINTQGGLSLRPRDMAKVGYLLMNGGRWKGRRVISKEWIDESTKGHITTGSHGYGYQWYRGRGVVNNTEFEAFWAWGRGGQLIFVFPTLDLVAVFTSKARDNKAGLYRPFQMLNRYILPAMLPPAEPRKKILLNPNILDEYVGQYRWDDGKAIVTLFREENTLYGKSPDGEIVELTPEAEDQFSGTSREIGDFQVTVKRGEEGKVNAATLYFLPFCSRRLKKVN